MTVSHLWEDPELVRLVTLALEMKERGVEPRIEEMCGDRDDLVAAVREAIGRAPELPELHAAAATHDGLTGRVLAGRYRLEQRLGAGSMGVVYRASDLELQREVAVKVLRAEFLTSGEAEQRFAREAEVLAAINHPAVVTIHDRGRIEGGGFFLVMELLRGVALSRVLEAADETAAARGGLDRLDELDWLTVRYLHNATLEPGYLRTVVGWIADLAGGLSAAHESGVLHRDIKPSNIFVTDAGAPVLLDFGIATRAEHETAADGTRTLGTPAYMAPEQLDREKLSPRVDVYGLAATLYHLASLQAPYTGTPSQILARLHKHEPAPAGAARSDLPRDLQAIIDRGMAREPARRYGTAAELEADLRAFLAHRPVSARSISGLTRAWRRARRSPAVRAGTGVALVAALAIGANVWWQGRVSARTADWASIWAHLPPALTLWRNPVLEGDRYDTAAALLDRAAATCVEPVPTLVVRAAFRRDHGDDQGAAADMAAVASHVGTPLARELARRYRMPTAGGKTIDVGGLPAPGCAEDAYIAGLHQLRAGKPGLARDTLALPIARNFPPAREIGLALQIPQVRGLPRERGLELARAIHESAVRLEAEIGRRTATTAHLIAAALICQELYEDAREPLRAGIALSTPAFHGLLANSAIVARRTGDLDGAIRLCREAIAIEPGAALAHETLVAIFIERFDANAAREALENAAVGRRARTQLMARIEFIDAVLAWEQGAPDTARAAGGRAIELFESLPSLEGFASELAFCRALVAKKDIFTALLEIASQDLASWRFISSRVLPNMPATLDESQTASVRRFFEAWAQHQAQRPR